jgi:hypothetical protein
MDIFWSVGAMPIGLFLCFTPIVIAWFIASRKGAQTPQNKDRR